MFSTYSLRAAIPYQFGTVDEGELQRGAGQSTLEVHLVRAGAPTPVPAQALELSQSDVPGQTYVWQWSVEETNGKWELNFSNRLRVSKVRILKGRRSPVTNRFFASDPQRPYVIPYRIEVGSLVCHADRRSQDGDIALSRCRQTSDDQAGTPIIVTPTYLNRNDQAPLIWKGVFNSSEGFTPPLVMDGEELAIEFTLEVQ